MATSTYSWSNQPAPPQGFSTSKTLVAPQTLPVPNQPTQSYATARTLVAPPAPVPYQPAPQAPLGAWPGQPAQQPTAPVWSNQPAPQRSQPQWSPQPAPQAGGWPNLSAPQEWSSAAAAVQPAPKPKRKGRGIVAWTLWVFAGGLFTAPLIADHADQAVEASLVWLATSAPEFVRPYLPKFVQALAPVATSQKSSERARVSATPAPVAMPMPVVAATPRPEEEPEASAEVADSAAVVARSPRAAEVERPSKNVRPRAGRGKHGKAAAALAVAEAPVAVENKTTEPKHGAAVDPFEGGGGAGEPSPTRAPKPVAEPSGQQGRARDSLDDLMAAGPGGDKTHDRRSTSKEIDAMLKGVQKSDPQPAPKRAESGNANPPLTSSDIARAMSSVKSSAAECGKRFGDSGVADLKLTVDKDGTVSNVAIRGKLAATAAGQCVVRAARNAVFPRNSGLTFDYRLDVR